MNGKMSIEKYKQVDPAGIRWDYEADVVVIGSGGAGLPAALKAQAEGASVIIVEAVWDVGGHAAVSGGNLHSGCGTKIQKKYGIEDSADLYYKDHTTGDILATRFNDRTYVRAIADHMAEAYEFLQEKGVIVQDRKPTMQRYYRDGGTEPESVPRWTVTDAAQESWQCYIGRNCKGMGVVRPLERTFRAAGGRILLNYHMDMLYRERQFSGRVLGVKAHYSPTILPGELEPLKSLWSNNSIETTQPVVNVKAKKAVILATGGSTGNLQFRRMIDPRLGPEFDGISGMPFSDQDASGEFAAMEIGASLSALAQYMQHGGHQMCMASRFGCQYGYCSYTEASPIWKLFRSKGFAPDYNSIIIVNMLGERFGNEDKCIGAKYRYEAYDFYDSAMASVLAPDEDGVLTRYGGPLWAVFDQAAVDRNQWDMTQNGVDWADGRCFRGDTLEELAQKVINKYYEHIKMDPKTLSGTVARYNGFVDAGVDSDWGKKTLKYRIEKGPFYAAWAMPSLHDTYGGLKCSARMQVIDLHDEVIPGLYAAGECTGGMRVHGFGRVMTSGFIAGKYAAAEVGL